MVPLSIIALIFAPTLAPALALPASALAQETGVPDLVQEYLSQRRSSDNSNCFSRGCLDKNFSAIVSLAENVAELEQYQALDDLLAVIKKLSAMSKENLEKSDLDDLLGSLLPHFPARAYISPIHEKVVHILEACDIKNTIGTFYGSSTGELKAMNKFTIDISKAKQIAVAKCVYDRHGALGFASSEKKKRCEKLVSETLEIVDYKNWGSFAGLYVDFLEKNPRFDKLILTYISEVEKILGPHHRIFINRPAPLTQQEISSVDGKNTFSATTKLQVKILKELKFDPGVIALRLTNGNEKDAIRLLQLVASDPGTTMLRDLLTIRLRKTDPRRAEALDAYLESSVRGDSLNLLHIARPPLLFGNDISINWSSRNYKVLAGMVLGLELAERGFTREEAKWAAQFTGEAYRASYVGAAKAQKKDISGEKKYFLADSAAHFIGGEFGWKVGSGSSLNDLAKNFSRLETEGRKNAQKTWDKIAGEDNIWELATKAASLLGIR